jgi:diaminohydroxyphosphoribosylaminopyrimidine deaminase/5-amino-6-(5-phosphoribosylamino)uracil reductase
VESSARPVRIILDSSARIPPDAALVTSAADVPTVIAITKPAPGKRVAALEAAGCIVLRCRSKSGRVSLKDLLRQLASAGATNVLVEGGGDIFGSIFDQRLADEVLAFVAPVIAGGSQAGTPVAGLGVAAMADAWGLVDASMKRSGRDILIRGRVEY